MSNYFAKSNKQASFSSQVEKMRLRVSISSVESSNISGIARSVPCHSFKEETTEAESRFKNLDSPCNNSKGFADIGLRCEQLKRRIKQVDKEIAYSDKELKKVKRSLKTKTVTLDEHKSKYESIVNQNELLLQLITTKLKSFDSSILHTLIKDSA